ncbi:MAG: DUF3127 domain-containing protein [Bacteroidales bacterium]|nr:DUF3127 domain-containing protein [Bacteroidales bacterium]
MALELKCKLVEKLQEERGSSARGAWCKQNFIVETVESYPRKICMNVWGDEKVSELRAYNVGEILNISINIESREFNGRWYTDVRAWRIQRDSVPSAQGFNGVSGNNPSGVSAPLSDPFIGAGLDGEDEGDLPF